MNSRSTLLLEHHLKELKLPSFLREYGKMAAQCAAEGVDHPQYLLRLAELELIDRHQRMVERRIRSARFPAVKTFDFTAIPSVNKALVMELARCEYVQRRENIIAVGNSGTGKTHIALGLGLAACQRGMSVGFTTAAALVHELMEARDERRLLNLQRQLSRLSLLIIDELGFVPLSPHPLTEERTFQHTFDLTWPETKKKPRKPRVPTRTVEEQTEARREYDKVGSQTPERKEVGRLRARQVRLERKEAGQCRDCSNEAIPGQTRCESCRDKHNRNR